MSENNAILDKIKKLLAKAQNTNSEHEADAFMKKAHELMIANEIELATVQGHKILDKNSIDLSMVDLNFITNKKEGDFAKYLIFGIARFNFCQGIFHESRGSEGSMSIVGQEHNRLSALAMIDWLLPTVRRLSKQAFNQNDFGEKWGKFNRGFLMGCAGRLRQRMVEIMAQAEAEKNQVKALVLVKNTAVQEYIENKFGNLRGSKITVGSSKGGLWGGP